MKNRKMPMILAVIILTNSIAVFPLQAKAAESACYLYSINAVYASSSTKQDSNDETSEEDDGKNSWQDTLNGMKNSAADKFSDAKESLSNAGTQLKEGAAQAASSASNKAEELKDSASKSAEELKNAATSAATDAAANAATSLNQAKDAASEGISNAVNATSEAGKAAAANAKQAVGVASEYVTQKAGEVSAAVVELREDLKEMIDSFDPSAYKKGWETASQLLSATAGSAATLLKDQKYIDSVSNQIQDLRSKVYEQSLKNGSTASTAGFVAEEWHAGSFNAAAKAAGSTDSATVLHSNAPGSVDVKTSFGSDYSLKYYKDGASSANAQAMNVIQEYGKYMSHCKNNGIEPMSREDFINAYGKVNDMESLYESIYAGQKRLIPAGQEQEAAQELKRKIATESSRDRAASEALVKGYEDTLSNLTATIQNPDGTISSVPLSKEDAEKIVELCRTGEFEPEDFGLSTAQLIPTTHIVNEAIKGGTQAAILNVAFTIGPEIYQIVKQSIENGELDANKLKETGLDGLTVGGEGFLEGTVSTALLECCATGKFGQALTDVSPATIGTMTVLMIDAARYAYQLYKGELSPTEYADMMAEEIFVAVASQGTGVLLQALLPMIPGVYFAGSIAGSMLATTGYESGKAMVLAVVNNGGLDSVIPVIADNAITTSITIADIKLSEALSSFDKLKVKDDISIKLIDMKNEG